LVGGTSTFRPLLSSAIREHDPGSNEPRAVAPRLAKGCPRYVAWVEFPLVEEAPAGLSRDQGPHRLLGPIQRRAFTIARERSGVSPIRLTRTPSVAASWEGRVENPVLPVNIVRGAPDLVARIE
jgi:hypothetical protein